jgi:membrane-bound transcription factor site-1 protease
MGASEMNATIAQIAGSDGFRIVPRFNPGALLPSDFAVIATDPESDAKIVSQLRSAAHVRFVVPQRKFTNILSEAWEGERGASDAGEGEREAFSERRIFEDGSEVEVRHRAHTQFAQEVEEEDERLMRMRRRLHTEVTQIPHLFNAQYLWDEGYSGKGIKVAVFDTGLEKDHPHFRNVVLRTDWTDEDTKDDLLGHGTFVAGVIASDSDCLGFAPDAEIYSFRVFTANRVSYTAWFLDAFNFAIQKRINVLNLSIGGPDFLDRPFVEKVWEMSANRIIVISAIGNDGPIYGTLNNPADHLDVIGVGGIDFKDRIASFSSRGMTTWELPHGAGRVKPDVVAYGHAVQGSGIGGGCKTLSGTSVASPVVAGAVALLASSVPEAKRAQILNPASMKQVLLAGARELSHANIFEQGAGKLDLIDSFEYLASYTPRATVFPAALDLTDCPYMWPYCTQPLFHGAQPVIFNVTILNGMGSSGIIVRPPTWIPAEKGDFLEISFTHSEYLWPWSGWLGLHMRVSPKAAKWSGVAQGLVEFTVQSPPGQGETSPRIQTVRLPVKVHVTPTPSRTKRILWDQFHNLRYPSGYLPRDALHLKQEPFDWNGDHPFTNFRDLFNHLRAAGFFIDILGDPYTCFNASQYGTLLIVDPEEEFFPEEIEKLGRDVRDHGLSVAVFADWYNEEVLKKITFFDENTKRMWVPITGGSNLPALNDLLLQWGIQFGDIVFDGEIAIDANTNAQFASGAGIAKFPKDGLLIPFQLRDQSTSSNELHAAPVLGFLTPSIPTPQPLADHDGQPGRIAVFGDSSCLDSAARLDRKNCFWLAKDIMLFTSQGILPSYTSSHNPLTTDFQSRRMGLPKRSEGNQLAKFSKVVGQDVVCQNLDFQRFNQSDNVPVIRWPTRRTATEPTTTQRLLFREGQSRARPTGGAYQPYGFVAPFFLGVGSVLIVVIVFLQVSKSKRSTSASSSNVVPAHL